VLGKVGEATIRLFSICIKVYCQEIGEGGNGNDGGAESISERGGEGDWLRSLNSPWEKDGFDKSITIP